MVVTARRATHVTATGRLFIVGNIRHVANKKPFKKCTRRTTAFMFLESVIFLFPLSYSYVTKCATHYIFEVCVIKSCGGEVVLI